MHVLRKVKKCRKNARFRCGLQPVQVWTMSSCAAVHDVESYCQMSSGGALEQALDYVKDATVSASRRQILKSRLESLRHEPALRLLEIAQSIDNGYSDGDDRDSMYERLQRAIRTANALLKQHAGKAVAKCLAIAAKIELKDRRDASRAQQEQVPSPPWAMPMQILRTELHQFTTHLSAGLQKTEAGSRFRHDRRW